MPLNNYFNSYNQLQVHELMLRDEIRNRCFARAIRSNAAIFANKIVLDLGCGTGILSVLCAQIGAKKVYAIEASDIFKVAIEIVRENKYADKIDVIHSAIEDVQLPVRGVDIIVSEWMGFYLVHESMVDSLIYARDKFLSPNGYLFPSIVTLYATPCSVPTLHSYWNSVEGVKMNSFGRLLREEKIKQPLIDHISEDDLLAEPTALVWWDLKEICKMDTEKIQEQFVVTAKKKGHYEGVCFWFTCEFPMNGSESPIRLDTGPKSLQTHWKQTVALLPYSLPVQEGSAVAFHVKFQRLQSESREYNIELTMLDPDEVVHPEDCSCFNPKCVLIRAMLKKYEADRGLQAICCHEDEPATTET